MEVSRLEFLMLLVNSLLIATTLTAPILIGMYLLSIVRRSLNFERANFEAAVLQKLENIRQQFAFAQDHLNP